jgi:arylsulfatase A-like enzyme
MAKQNLHVVIAALVAGSFASSIALAQESVPAARPNFVVVLVDDLAFTDLGVYGGEARTPNLDMLAARGARFSSYHTSPLCSPSRAMLLTGIDNHRTGVATIPETLPAAQRGKRGYSMHLEDGVETVATRLKGEGYRTYMSGKWHLGQGIGQLPDSHGFQRSLALDASGADNWQQKSYMPYYATADWFEDGKPVQLPENFYSSELLVDRMLGYLNKDRDSSAPFFAYVAFQAVHIPVQAPREFTEHYAGVYDGGWDALRERRWKRAKELGLIPADAELPPAHEGLRKWDALSPQDKALFSRSMAVYAGMIEAMDAHIGRLVAHLNEHGELDNTIFIITSDNGPEPSDPVAQTGFSTWMSQHGYVRELETLGEKGSMNFIGPEWANAASSPARLFKFHSAEGGLRVPLIVSGPGITPSQLHSLGFVTDLTPTIYDFAGIDPAKWNGPVPITGKSLKPVLTGAASRTYADDVAIGMEVGGNAALYKGDYKITRITQPWGDAKWRLYHLSADPGETRDLSEQEPERFHAMLVDYDAYAKDMGVLALPDDFNPHRQVKLNAYAKQAQQFRVQIAVICGVVVLIGFGLWRWWRRRAA